MKKNFYYLLLPALMALVNCTAEQDDYQSMDEQVQQRVHLIEEMSKDYGLDNFKVDAGKVRASMHLSIDDIEKEMRALSMLKGTYHIIPDGNGNYHIGEKVVNSRKTRSGFRPDATDDVNADISNTHHQGDTITIDYSFHLYFDTAVEHPVVSNTSFHAVVKVKNEKGGYDEQTFDGEPNINVDRLVGHYPRYTVCFTVRISSSVGYSFNAITAIEDIDAEESGTNTNTFSYGVIQ